MLSRSPPLKYSSIRIYPIDLSILSYIITNNHDTRPNNVSKYFKVSKRLIRHHLKKLANIGLIESHSSAFNPLPWYSIPNYNIDLLNDLLGAIKAQCRHKKINNTSRFVFLKVRPIPSPPNHPQFSEMSIGRTNIQVCTSQNLHYNPYLTTCKPERPYTRRLYYTDLRMLHFFRSQYYDVSSKELSAHLRLSRRSTNRHIKKFVDMGLIERHGTLFCRDTHYTIPEYNTPALHDLLHGLDDQFRIKRLKAPKKNSYVFLEVLPLHVPTGFIGQTKISTGSTTVSIRTSHRVYNDPCRPGGHSLRFARPKQASLDLFSHSPLTEQTHLSAIFQSFLRDFG